MLVGWTLLRACRFAMETLGVVQGYPGLASKKLKLQGLAILSIGGSTSVSIKLSTGGLTGGSEMAFVSVPSGLRRAMMRYACLQVP